MICERLSARLQDKEGGETKERGEEKGGKLLKYGGKKSKKKNEGFQFSDLGTF